MLSPLEGILEILQRGQVTGTNKFGLLLALIDLAPHVDPELREIRQTELALKLLEIHWDHAQGYGLGGVPLRQVSSGNRKNSQVIQQVERLREVLGDEYLPFEVARREISVTDWHEAVAAVLRDAVRNPLARLQFIPGTNEAPFLFAPVCRSEPVVLFPQAHEQLIAYGTLLKSLVEARFVEAIMRMNSSAFMQVDLHDFLFGVGRNMPSENFRRVLLEVQGGRCVYTGVKLKWSKSIGSVHLDHVLPWSRVRLSTAENFVVTTGASNREKRDLLLSPESLTGWLMHLQKWGADIHEAAVRCRWPSNLSQTLQVARSLYRFAAVGTSLWAPGARTPLDRDARRRCLDAIDATSLSR